MSSPVRPRTEPIVDASFAYRLDVLERLGQTGPGGTNLQARPPTSTCCDCISSFSCSADIDVLDATEVDWTTVPHLLSTDGGLSISGSRIVANVEGQMTCSVSAAYDIVLGGGDRRFIEFIDTLTPFYVEQVIRTDAIGVELSTGGGFICPAGNEYRFTVAHNMGALRSVTIGVFVSLLPHDLCTVPAC